MYYQGKGVPRDYPEAVRWYRKAADQGYAKAQYDLGNMYSQGKGVPQDYAEAARWYRKAADQGDTRAQRILGLRTRPGAPTKMYLSLAFVGSVLLLIDSLLPNGRRIRNRQRRATRLTGLVGLSWVALNLYGLSDVGILQSVSGVNAFSFAKDFLAGVFAVMLIFLLSSPSAKIILGVLLGFNLYAVAHGDLRRLAPAPRIFYSVNGLLVGTSIASATALALPAGKD
jgi:Sel1 repeat